MKACNQVNCSRRNWANVCCNQDGPAGILPAWYVPEALSGFYKHQGLHTSYYWCPVKKVIQQFTCFTLNCITFGLTGGRNFLGSTHQRGKYPPNSPPPPVSHRPDVKRNSVSATTVEKTCHLYSMSWYFDNFGNYSQSLLSHEGETLPSRQASRLSVSRCWNRLPSVIEPGSVFGKS